MPDDVYFEAFSTPHIAAMVMTVAVPLALIAGVRAGRSLLVTRIIGIALGLLLLANEAAFRIAQYREHGFDPRWDLPLHLCDLTVFIAVLALWRPRQWLFELAWYWGFAGTLQAILTPDIWYTWPDWRFVSFFISHGGIIAAALYLAFALEFRPVAGWFWRVFLATQVYLVAAAAANGYWQANYGFLCRKPDQPSLLDYCGPWPWYLLVLETLAALSLVFYNLPFVLLRRGRTGDSKTDVKKPS